MLKSISKEAVRLDGLKILTVDDHEDNRILFSIILKSLGAVVKVADSVETGLNILSKFEPELVLSDISMPGENGYDLLRKIRACKTCAEIPVVALTAYAGPDDARRMLNAGFSAHIGKPVEKATLSRVIAELVKS